VTAEEVRRRCDYVRAADALEAALGAGLDPESEPLRGVLELDGGGQLLVMPSSAGGRAAVKLVTVGGDPRIQGICVVFDPVTLAPAAIVEARALTELRTAATSALAVRRLAPPDVRRLLVFGAGPQGRAHVEAISAVRPIEQVDVVDLGAGEVERRVAAADVICCCTTAREPLFDGALVADHATVVAIGSHEPDAREVDEALVRRATIVVESRASALREAGDVTIPLAAGVVAEADLVTLAELVRGAAVAPDRPRFFKSTGMAWQDAVVAAVVVA